MSEVPLYTFGATLQLRLGHVSVVKGGVDVREKGEEQNHEEDVDPHLRPAASPLQHAGQPAPALTGQVV